MKTPDFEEWAARFLTKPSPIGESLQELVSRGLKEGYELGAKTGYILGTDFGWITEQDKHYKDCEHE